MRHINGCDRGHSVVTGSQGHRRFLGVVTGSPKDFWCGHRVTINFQHCRMGSRRSCAEQSKNFARTSNGAASA